MTAPTRAFPDDHAEATAIHAVPAQLGSCGFRLLLVREFRAEDAPPAFAFVEQHLVRTPHRLNRHGISFALTFRPEVMAALTVMLGRPSVRAGDGPAMRNPAWPTLAWASAPRHWADGTATLEWLADARFPDAASWTSFRERFAGPLAGRADLLTGDTR